MDQSADEKVCTKCKIKKSLSDFGERRRRVDSYDSQCKKCRAIASAERRKNNPVAERMAVMKWRASNYDKFKKSLSRGKNANPVLRKVCAKRHYNKVKETPRFKINSFFYTHLRRALSGKIKKSHTDWQSFVGFTKDELRNHFEKLFLPGMTWGNYGLWEMDHVIPICKFDYESTDSSAFRECWSLKNLQPLWKSEHVKKDHDIKCLTRMEFTMKKAFGYPLTIKIS